VNLLATASTAAGTTLTEPVDLGGSDRTTVLRCRTPEATTVVVRASCRVRNPPDRLRPRRRIDTFRQLIEATEHWGVEPLPLYPAWTPSPPTTVNS
jgi:hypothetical protein